jgi:hypothetical protein
VGLVAVLAVAVLFARRDGRESERPVVAATGPSAQAPTRDGVTSAPQTSVTIPPPVASVTIAPPPSLDWQRGEEIARIKSIRLIDANQGNWLCVAYDLVLSSCERNTGPMPSSDVPTSILRPHETPDATAYVVQLPQALPQTLSVRDSLGTTPLFSRSADGRFVLLSVAKSPPLTAPRTFDFVTGDGQVVARGVVPYFAGRS